MFIIIYLSLQKYITLAIMIHIRVYLLGDKEKYAWIEDEVIGQMLNN